MRKPPSAEAVALAYEEGMVAPAVVARGRGAIAEQILQRAREAGLYVHQSRELVSVLMQVDLDRQIPPVLYLAIAELLVWVHRIEQLHLAGRTDLLGTQPTQPDVSRHLPTGLDAASLKRRSPRKPQKPGDGS